MLTEMNAEEKLVKLSLVSLEHMRKHAKLMGREIDYTSVGGLADDVDCFMWPDIFTAMDEMADEIIELRRKLKEAEKIHV